MVRGLRSRSLFLGAPGGARAPTVFPAFGCLLGRMLRVECVMSHENVLACGSLSFANAAAAS